ncbi:MAG: hypothetical protein K2X47_11095, partial [Bdellovibrionales bacterium]|nr:hypothetical protein [Bdellovibrionales bacterium]
NQGGFETHGASTGFGDYIRLGFPVSVATCSLKKCQDCTKLERFPNSVITKKPMASHWLCLNSDGDPFSRSRVLTHQR